jgi:hypothetical protein
MRVLERNAEITTRYGGGFVQSIEGLGAARDDGRSWDWFFFVNGVESSVGAADHPLDGGEQIWWDYRDWSAAMRAPAVVGSWPQPFSDGYEGRPRPTFVECLGGGDACDEVRRRLRGVGATLAEQPSDAIRVLVGPWARLRGDPTAAQLERGPQESGVFADFSRRDADYELLGLDEGGRVAERFGRGAGLVAAMRRFEAPPTWLVTGSDRAGVIAAAGLLDDEGLRDRYAVAIEAEEEAALPLGR